MQEPSWVRLTWQHHIFGMVHMIQWMIPSNDTFKKGFLRRKTRTGPTCHQRCGAFGLELRRRINIPTISDLAVVFSEKCWTQTWTLYASSDRRFSDLLPYYNGLFAGSESRSRWGGADCGFDCRIHDNCNASSMLKTLFTSRYGLGWRNDGSGCGKNRLNDALSKRINFNV